MRDPIVTVIILTKDRHELVRAAIRSALNQTVADIEVIVVDDESTVPVRIDIEDARVRLVRNERNLGMSASRNIGLEAARGLYVTYLDDDDELLPDMVRTSLHTIRVSALPAPVAALSAMVVVNSDSSIHEMRYPVTLPRGSQWNLSHVERGSFMANNTLFVQTTVLREAGGWDERLLAYEKADLFLRLNSICSLQGTDDVTYRMLNHTGPRVHSRHVAYGDAMVLTDNKHAGAFRMHSVQRGHRLSVAATYYLKGGRWSSAVRTSVRALRYYPASGLVWTRFAASICGPIGLALYRGLRRQWSRLR